MNRKLLPPTIIAVTLTIILGLLHSFRLVAASAPAREPAFDAASIAIIDFTVEPLHQGEFAGAASTGVFTIEVQNTGTAPTDTYELVMDSDWSTVLYGPDGITPLSDTNGSGGIDTGVIAQGQSFVINARVEAPAGAVVGDENNVAVAVHSTISPVLSYTASIRSAVPAPFAQTVFQQQQGNNNLFISQPDGSWQSQTTPDHWYDRPDILPEMALVETDTGYFYLWLNTYEVSEKWRAELIYRLTDKPGQPVTGITKLTDHTSASVDTWDAMPAVAVAPNGNIGVSWFRRSEMVDGSQLYNVYLAILDPAGQPVTDTINVTNNSAWRGPGQPDFDVPTFRAPAIAAMADDHFFVAWESSVLTYTEKVTETYNLDDIYYAIYASDGVSITEPINISENVPGEPTRSLRPAAAGVNVDRAFLSWAQRRPVGQGGDDILYTVIDSSNATIKSISAMAADTVTTEWSNFDVVETSSGEIIAAWEAYGCPGYSWSPRIRYAVFRANNYNRMGQPACLPATVVATGGDEGASLVPDNQGHAILTWTDRTAGARRHLYYALLNASGTVATNPMIFYHNEETEGILNTGLNGYGSASRIFLDMAILIDPPVGQGISAEPVPFTVDVLNYGSLTGTGVVITMTLAPSLSHFADNAPSPPTIEGQDVVWSLGNALPWGHYSFDVAVSISSTAKLMQSYPLTVTVGVTGQEATLANNSASAAVIVSRQFYLPAIIRAK